MITKKKEKRKKRKTFTFYQKKNTQKLALIRWRHLVATLLLSRVNSKNFFFSLKKSVFKVELIKSVLIEIK